MSKKTVEVTIPPKEEDEPELPPDTLAILEEFLQNKNERNCSELRFFEEDWQLSQFWYNNETKQILSSICSKLVHNKREQKIEPINIALISCPSIYELVKSYVRNVANIRLFEFDMRFSTFGDDFVYYDYKDECNESISKIYQRTFDILIADPPFLSEECIIKYSNFIKVLQKDNSNVVLCSGQTVSGWIEEALHLHQCKFHPEHENNLANQFRCYANFDLDTLL